MDESADFWIKELSLQPHPEGGYFREMYRSDEFPGQLPARYKGGRCFSTSIYYLLTGKDISALHRIASDETWHFYTGCPMQLLTLDEISGFRKVILGNNPHGGEHLQYTIPHGTWFGGRPLDKDSFSLLGCTVAPGFDFSDFELGNFRQLFEKFPDETDLLKEFCIN